VIHDILSRNAAPLKKPSSVKSSAASQDIVAPQTT